MLLDPKKKKIGLNTYDCMFIGYASNSTAYGFLVLKSNILECNAIIETKNAKLFEHFFPLYEKFFRASSIKDDIENSYNEHVPTTIDDMESSHIELRRSKGQIQELYLFD